MAVQEIQRSNLGKAAKRQLEAMLRAAANPNAESPAEVIKTLEPERRMNVEGTISTLARRRRTITTRGQEALFGFTEDEWQQMVDEANEDGD